MFGYDAKRKSEEAFRWALELQTGPAPNELYNEGTVRIRGAQVSLTNRDVKRKMALLGFFRSYKSHPPCVVTDDVAA